ncbi:2-hydroxychromene-2-carboxylate isomerase [Roseobacter sp. HKCCA0434]|uniref:2-hydroxychromene-2-carboxylate isomerase n=1 Tax=Roseobacter sp. HKCCA0434 TaxID=3079297 RepID=UPI002905C831|nr:2-hydroxychromene-2-carboxylate isomerase [Roseobacter sp. HKCCA0434]
MATIDYYLFPLSPFTYLAGMQLEEVAAKHGAEINYKPFDLMRVFAEHGTPPVPKRHPARQAYRLQELKRIAAANDLPINVQPAHWPTDPKPACAAVIYAQEFAHQHPGGDVGKLSFNLLRACWAEEKDIAHEQVVERALEDAGFDGGLAQRDLQSAFDIFEKNTEEALAANVFGAPSYVVDGEMFWGQDRLSYLDRHLEASA